MENKIVELDGKKYTIAFSADSWETPYAIGFPNEHTYRFINKDKKAKEVWNKLKQKKLVPMKTEQFIKHINTLRKTNKNNWYQFSGTVNGKKVSIKGFNTWLQVFSVDGLYYPTTMEVSVKEFNQNLKLGLQEKVLI